MRKLLLALALALFPSVALAQITVTPPGVAWPMTAPAGGALRTGTTAADTLKLQAYDVDGAAYTTLLTLTAGNTPTLIGRFGEGSQAAPAVALGATGTGLFISGGYPRYAVSGTALGGWFTTGTLNTFYSVYGYDISGNGDTLLRREAANVLQFNDDANGAVAAFTVKSAD